MNGNKFIQSLGLPLKSIIVAPMVDQSELPFRMLCRYYGAKLCYTPMLHARIFAEKAEYRNEKFTTCQEDRPLIAQFCGHDPDVLLEAAKLIEDRCDAIDLNLGCPQNIARRGRYGAFLLEEGELLSKIVKHLSSNLKIPVTCKIRLLDIDDIDKTIKLAKLLEESGCSILTVHGRTKEQNKAQVGKCNWDAIKRIKEELTIPVFANGGIGSRQDVKDCLEYTGVDGVMSSEGILENPALISSEETMPTPAEIASKYLEMIDTYPDRVKFVRAHLFKFLHGMLEAHPEMRVLLTKSYREESIPEYKKIVHKLIEMHQGENACKLNICQTQQTEYGVWYDRYLKSNKELYRKCEKTGDLILKGQARGRKEDIIRLREEKKKRKQESKLKRIAASRKRKEASQQHHMESSKKKRG